MTHYVLRFTFYVLRFTLSSSHQGPNRYDAPTERHGYVPPAPSYAQSHARPHGQPVSGVVDDRHHPLHHVYRKRIRGVRMRWFGSGCLLGLLTGIFSTLIASALVVTQIPAVVETLSGEPDVSILIGEAYLNRQAANRLQTSNPVNVPNLALTGVNIDLKPDNRMDLQATFNANVEITTLQVSASVKNQLTVQDGQLVIAMVGDPQLGNLNLPLNYLPFDLNGRVKQAIDKINNDVLISEINQSLQSGFGGSQFSVQGVTTTETGMTIRLQQK